MSRQGKAKKSNAINHSINQSINKSHNRPITKNQEVGRGEEKTQTLLLPKTENSRKATSGRRNGRIMYCTAVDHEACSPTIALVTHAGERLSLAWCVEVTVTYVTVTLWLELGRGRAGARPFPPHTGPCAGPPESRPQIDKTDREPLRNRPIQPSGSPFCKFPKTEKARSMW